MPYLLPFIAIVGVEVAGVYGFAERFECGELVPHAGFCERCAEARFVALDCEAQDVVFVCGDAGLGQEEVVREQEREDGRELYWSANAQLEFEEEAS